MLSLHARPRKACARTDNRLESPQMETDSPLVTVIVPTFNRRALLPSAIRSIRNQTLRDWRLLVVNDGGEDVSDVVAEFADGRIEWHDRPHLGKAAALNFGLSRVRSKYVAYMDDDDIVFPDHLAGLVALAESEGAEFVYSDTWAVWIGPDGKEIRRQVENEDDVTFEDLRFFNQINHKQILHTKRLADEAGPYDERLRILIDYDYIRRLARLSPPVHLRKVTGEHFLRQKTDSAEDIDSITGLWKSDPETCGRSVAAVFEKDPAALADLYRNALRDRNRARALERALKPHQEALADARDTIRRQNERIRALESSLSFRLGQALTAPFRAAIDVMRRIRR